MPVSTTGGKLLIDCLINQGVDTAFGVPGESYLAVLDALHDVQDQLRLIVTRNEGGAGFMAEAYGKLTGRPGICFVTRGPGATNASIGVHTAMQNSSPMILFIGQIGRDMKDREAFQEIDYRAFYGSVAKWVTEIDNADRIPEIIARAFSTALSGRPGPVVIALPEDMLTSQANADAAPKVEIAQPAPDRARVGQAVAALNAAKRPLMIVGGGGWSAAGRAGLKKFALASGLPIACAFRSQDLLDNDSESYIGDAALGMSATIRQMITDADLIFAVNIRFGETVTDAWTLMEVPNAHQKLIHSHLSINELGKVYQADIPICSSPENLFSALLDHRINGDWDAWLGPARAAYVASLKCPPQKGTVDMGVICAYLRQELDENAIITNGAGNFAIWSGKFLTYTGNQRLLGPQSGAMGAGVPAAIAAKAVDPARQVLCFAGDGDFQMTCSELGTAMQEGLQPIILILNNGMYGTIRMHQEQRYPERVSGTAIINPDFVALAQAYGFYSQKIVKTEEFAGAFLRAKASKSGAVLELMLDQQDLLPRQKLAEMTAQGKQMKGS